MKISIIGAGDVGTMTALFLNQRRYDNNKIILFDTELGIAEGKALDISQCNYKHVTGITNDYSVTKNSDFIVITIGSPLKFGMIREELISINENIVKDALDKSFEYSPNATFIIVSDPVDTMTYLAVKYLGAKGVKSDSIIGFGNDLDTSRFKYYLNKIGINDYSIAYVIGGHTGKTMIPIFKSDSSVDNDKLNVAIAQTKSGDSVTASLLGTSPSIASGYALCNLISFLCNFESNEFKCCSMYNPYLDVCIGTKIIKFNGAVERIECPAKYMGDYMVAVEDIKKLNSLLHV